MSEEFLRSDWQLTADEHRRAFVLENVGLAGATVEDMEAVFQWLKHGWVEPKAAGAHLKPVK